MTPGRLEEELFGSEEGAGKTGLLERAHGGTLLLDEIADMPPETQGKVVRVLQEQEFLRVGGSQRVSVRRAGHCDFQPRPRSGGGAGAAAPGPVLPAQRRAGGKSHPSGGAARTFLIW